MAGVPAAQPGGCCSVCGALPTKGKGKKKALDGTVVMFACSVCASVSYCSRECQKKDWKTHKKVCDPLLKQSNPDEQFKNAMAAASAAKKAGDKAGEAAQYRVCAAIMGHAGRLDKALEFEQASLSILRDPEVEDKREECQTYERMGKLLTYLRNQDAAANCFNSQRVIAGQLGEKEWEYAACQSLASTYLGAKNYAPALDFYNQALAIAKELEDVSKEMVMHTYIGRAYHGLGNLEEAQIAFETGLALALEKENLNVQGSCYGNLGKVYSDMNQLEKAKEFHLKCILNAKQTGNRAAEARSYANIGVCYRLEKKYKQSVEYARMGLNIAVDIGDLLLEHSCYAELSKTHNIIDP